MSDGSQQEASVTLELSTESSANAAAPAIVNVESSSEDSDCKVTAVIPPPNLERGAQETQLSVVSEMEAVLDEDLRTSNQATSALAEVGTRTTSRDSSWVAPTYTYLTSESVPEVSTTRAASPLRAITNAAGKIGTALVRAFSPMSTDPNEQAVGDARGPRSLVTAERGLTRGRVTDAVITCNTCDVAAFNNTGKQCKRCQKVKCSSCMSLGDDTCRQCRLKESESILAEM